ncbi:MAG: EamA family transporter RarD [Planctomycetota bacterium]
MLRRTEPLSATHTGIAMGVTAHVMWGLFPLYFVLIKVVPPPVILGYRVVWSAVLMLALLPVLRVGPSVRTALADRATLAKLTLSAALIAVNWLTFIYAVTTERALQASLGYFITPLAIVALGVIVLGERLGRVQLVCLAIASAGVTFKIYATGSLPWIALVLPATFGVYSLIRKTTPADSRTALTVETLVLAPLGIGYIAFVHTAGHVDHVPWSPGLLALLSVSGVMTVAPLLLYGGAAKRLHLSTLGFIQYLGPTMQMLIATLALREPFTQADATTFTLIWLALAIYTYDAIQRERRKRTHS